MSTAGEQHEAGADDGLPREIGAPATRALEGAGYSRLAQLDGVAAADLLRLHGVGPRAVRILTEALANRGRSLT
jgi:hypothetical protein